MDNDLSKDINYIRGPHGQVVVVVRPNQEQIVEMMQVQYNEAWTMCAVYWGIFCFPFVLIGFCLTCVGLSMLKEHPDHPVLLIGGIFFGIGLFACVIFVTIMICMRQEHKDNIHKYMHYGTANTREEERQLITLPPNEVPPSEMSPYHRFMMYGGSEGASPATPYGGQISDLPSGQSTTIMWPLQTNTSGGNSFIEQQPSAVSQRNQPYSDEPQVEWSERFTGFRTIQNSSEEASFGGLTSLPLFETAELPTGSLQTNVAAGTSSLHFQVEEENPSPVQESCPSFPSGRRSPYDNAFSGIR